jgi:shikimate dehydrogenase
MERVVLLGHHIGYSASPAMHNAAFAALGLPLAYELRDTPGEALAAAIEELRGYGLRGANVTQPHKVAVCELVDDRDPAVERIGAANTIVRQDGRLIAHNTDLAAIADELAELLPGAPRRAFVLGAGGASRAAVAALNDRGTDTVVVNREGWHRLNEELRHADLLVNATPIGTASDESPVDAAALRDDLAVLDLVYRPSPTRLVRDARAAGATARDGAGVLLRQAAASLSLWTGLPAPIEVMRAALDAELAAVPVDG